MKYLLLYIIMFRACSCYTQLPATGLYKSPADFVMGKLSWSGKEARIRIHDLFRKNILEIKYHDTLYTLQKKELYGYRDKEGNCYRFFNHDIYLILNPGEKILLYIHSSGTGFRGSPKTDTYFFSENVATELLPLTLKHIAQAFINDPDFKRLAELYFRSDDELPEYDPVHYMYKINRLMELANNK